MNVFSMVYRELFETLMRDPRYNVNFACRGLQMAKEMLSARIDMDISEAGVCVFSHPTHRVVPIRFILAELAFILAGRKDLAVMMSYNKGMAKYSNDGSTLGGSYGDRLLGQLDAIIDKLNNDPYTRQACGVIFQKMDMLDSTRVHIPCNVFIQFLYRKPVLSMHVTSRSSDFVTGFSIDTVHWQFLLKYLSLDLWFVDAPKLRLFYNLASLHIYAADIPIIEQWDVTQMYEHAYTHFLRPTIGLHQVMKNCRDDFRENMTCDELSDLLGLDETSRYKVVELHEMFKTYKNELKR